MKRSAPQNATLDGPAGDPIASLPPEQLAALECLGRGDTVTSAAAAAGVSRETVHRWLRENWAFQAALNAVRAEMRDATEQRLLAVAKDAADNLLTAVQSGSLTASLAVLRGTGFLSGKPALVGPQDPAVVAEDAEMAEAQRRRAQELQRLMSAVL